jgi:ubiquinone/menaquinone biosynthesis C-methylase UbiE
MHNASQSEFWNGKTGENWVTHDALMETMLQPLGEAVIETLAPIAGERVLDIGCGCGHTSLSLAHRVGAEGAITGIDISAPMLSVARTLAENRAEPSATIEFVQADAQTHDIQPDSFDAVFSRFGVMFFEDPVAAWGFAAGSLEP